MLGISETRENYSLGFKVNNDFDGYILHSQHSRSALRGMAIYTRHTLNAFKRTDLTTTDDEFELSGFKWLMLKVRIFYAAVPIDTLPLAL